MTANHLTFRQLIAPIDGDVFLRDHYRRRPLHIPGAEDKLSGLFSWNDLNNILAMSTIWSDATLELAIDGKRIPPGAYCYEGTTRDNDRGQMPDYHRVHRHLERGATLALNQIARLTPDLRAVAQSLEAVFGAPAHAVAFVSFESVAGYFSHFDTTNAFACHIAGRKIWRVYKGRHDNASGHPHGHGSAMTREQHAEARGEVLMEVEMTPGDVLYIPHGQYHDAIATSEASLHITFGVRHMVVQDFLNRLLPDLSGDPFFRAHLPAYDDAAGRQKVGEGIAARLGQVLADQNVLTGLGDFLQGKAFERESAFQFPDRGRAPTYRVRWPGRRLEQRGQEGCRLTASDGTCLATLDGIRGDVATWVYERDMFQLGEMLAAFSDQDPDGLQSVIGELEDAGLLERL
jgi:ribosomal protein L16 Arg81 hydroxylase